MSTNIYIFMHYIKLPAHVIYKRYPNSVCSQWTN